jgi:hypothetical protein
MILLSRSLAAASFILFPALTLSAQTAELCLSQERTALYGEYYYSKGKSDAATQKHAYETAKKYLAKYEVCADEFTDAVKKFAAEHEAATERFNLTQAAFGGSPDPVKAYEIGRRILAANPGDLPTMMALAHVGELALAAKNDALVKESLAHAKKAVQAIEAGKEPDAWTPYKSRDEALGYLYTYIANMTIGRGDSAGAIAWYLAAAKSAGPAKTMPATYGRLAAAYHAGMLEPMQDRYNKKFAGKYESAEGKFEYEQVTQVMDRVIDAYARAVHLSGDDPKYAAAKAAWLGALKAFYQVRAGEKMPGFDEYVAKAMDRPLPAAFEPKTFNAKTAASSKRK